MRLGWHVHLFGPFSLGGTIWQSRRRRSRAPWYYGWLDLPDGTKWQCPHHHQRLDTAEACAGREARRRGLPYRPA